MGGGLNPILHFLSECFPLSVKCSIEPRLKIDSQIQTFWVDFKQLEQCIWAHPHILMKMRHFGAINGFMGNIYINITCSSPFWIQWCQMCLDWTIPPEVRAVYIFWLGGWGYEPHASFVIWMSSQQTRIVLKTLTFKLQPMILNWYLRNTFRSDHLVKNVASLYISHRGGLGF